MRRKTTPATDKPKRPRRARTKKVDVPKLEGEELRAAMRSTRETLDNLLRRGYGDYRDEQKIREWREIAKQYQAQDPAMWNEVAAEARSEDAHG